MSLQNLRLKFTIRASRSTSAWPRASDRRWPTKGIGEPDGDSVKTVEDSIGRVLGKWLGMSVKDVITSSFVFSSHLQ
jgi:hypothetical protein